MWIIFFLSEQIIINPLKQKLLEDICKSWRISHNLQINQVYLFYTLNWSEQNFKNKTDYDRAVFTRVILHR